LFVPNRRNERAHERKAEDTTGKFPAWKRSDVERVGPIIRSPSFFLIDTVGGRAIVVLSPARWHGGLVLLEPKPLVDRGSCQVDPRSNLFRRGPESTYKSKSPQSFRSSQYSSSEDDVDDDDDDLSWIPHTKVAHDKAFDKFVAKGKLCEADIDRILEDKSFVRFAFTSRNTTK